MAVSVITSKGQTTIPKKIRNYLRLVPGDKLDFVIGEDGKVLVEPATLDVGDIEGLLHRPGMKTVTESEIKEAVKKRFRKAALR